MRTQRLFATTALVVFGILAVAGSACGGGENNTDNQTAQITQEDLVKFFVSELEKSSGASQAPTTNKESSAKPTSVATATKSDSSATASQPTTAPTTKPAPTRAEPTAPPPPQTVNGLAHRGAGSFSAGEAVIGYEIVMNGLKYRQCYFSSAPSGGTVSDGVVNPWPGEVIYSACGQGVEDPDTVNGRARRGAGSFSAGEAVSGYEITIGGLKYRLCYFLSAPGNGTVSDGVINPYPGEVLSRCGQGVEDPDTVNGHFRRGPGAFVAGEAVTGFFTLNGVKYENCYMSSTPSGGTVTDGVVNPWIKEAADDRVC